MTGKVGRVMTIRNVTILSEKKGEMKDHQKRENWGPWLQKGACPCGPEHAEGPVAEESAGPAPRDSILMDPSSAV